MAHVYIAADHAGYELKSALIPYIRTLGYEVVDLGAHALDIEDDYPDIVLPCAQKVGEEPEAIGIVIGASGQGEAMVANRVSGVRAAVFYGAPTVVQTDAHGTTLDIISSMRAHNDANVFSLGARFITTEDAKEAVERFLSTSFSGDERHIRRISKY